MNPEPAAIQPIECCGIRCTEGALSEIEANRVVITVPKKDIVRITLRHGVQAPNPTIQILFGLALASVGYFPLRSLIYWMQHGGILLWTEQLIMVVAGLGVWTTFEALKRGYFLEIQLAKGFKRLAFIERNYGIAVLREDHPTN